jgi:hypothetical protein
VTEGLGDRVFFSFAEEDKPQVDWIMEGVEASSTPTFRFDRDLESGRPWIQQLENAMEACRAIVLVMSRHTPRSWFVNAEQNAAFYLYPSGKRVVLVLLDSPARCKVPLFIRVTFQWLDFTDRSDQGRAIAMRKLLKALRPEAPLPPRQYAARLWRKASKPVVTSVFALAVLALVPASCRMNAWMQYQALLRAQEAAQKVDAEVETYIKRGEVELPKPDGESVYRRPVSGTRLAVDMYRSSRLVRRDLYAGDHGERKIAIDEYTYSGRQVTGKKRQHLNDQNIVYLIDEFDGTGVVRKRHCPSGRPTDCILHLESQGSPFATYAFLPTYR